MERLGEQRRRRGPGLLDLELLPQDQNEAWPQASRRSSQSHLLLWAQSAWRAKEEETRVGLDPLSPEISFSC